MGNEKKGSAPVKHSTAVLAIRDYLEYRSSYLFELYGFEVSNDFYYSTVKNSGADFLDNEQAGMPVTKI